jgi:S-adenosylmethionine hydrolase
MTSPRASQGGAERATRRSSSYRAATASTRERQRGPRRSPSPGGGEHRAGAVFLLTDYGYADEFAGMLRAVLAREAPGAPVVDLTHAIRPFDVRAGALALERIVPHLGPGVVVAVVDPGVGTTRRLVAVERAAPFGPRCFVGPDNGLLGFALDALGGLAAAVELDRQAVRAACLGGDATSAGAAFLRVGPTFDGRDVFAPAAAALWRGVPLSALGSTLPLGALVRLEPPWLAVIDAPGERVRVEAEVTWVDGFGNVQLSATPAELARVGDAERWEVHIGELASAGLEAGAGPSLLADATSDAPARRHASPREPSAAPADASAAPPDARAAPRDPTAAPRDARAAPREPRVAPADARGGPPASATARPRSLVARRVRAFAELDPGEAGLLLDSTGRIALVLHRASAAARLGLAEGDRVELVPLA